MLFSSFAFALFFPAVLGIYWALPARARTLFLLAASYLFYAWWNWWVVLLLVASTLVDYLAAIRIERDRAASAAARETRPAGRRWLAASLVFQLGVLGVFKYYDFFADSLAALLAFGGVPVRVSHLRLLLPAGISFYTFKTIAYTVDVYRGVLPASRSFAEYALHVAFFPALLAGPIARAKDFLAQIRAPRAFDLARLIDGAHLVFWGLVKKVFIADNLAGHVDRIFALASPTGFDALLGSYLFAVQIYCDFSGYTDVARGLAACLGYELPINFRYPYLSANPSEFWQRWHVSFSTWIRDYIFLPLGGAWKGSAQGYRNLAITMVLAGLWHGASWVFVAWGAYQGVLLVGHRVTQPWIKRAGRPFRRAIGRRGRKVLKVVLTFHLVCLGWLLFRAESFSQAAAMLGALFTNFGAVDASRFLPLLAFASPLLVVEGLELAAGREDVYRVPALPAWTKTVAYAVLCYLLVFRGASTQGFIYTQF